MKKSLAGALAGFLMIAVIPAHASEWVVFDLDDHKCEVPPFSFIDTPLKFEEFLKRSNTYI